MKFSLVTKPRALSLEAFSWDDNCFSRLFKGCGGSAGFIQAWKENQGSISSSLPNDIEKEYPVLPPTVDGSCDSRKRQANSSPLPCLVPVSKKARIVQVIDDQQDKDKIDEEEIGKYFIGE